MRLSVIIPAINEQAFISAAVQSAFDAGAAEVIVVDGGSSDDTIPEAKHCGAKVVSTSPGRARQMNHGARLSCGTVVLFLHADCRLPLGSAAAVERAIQAGSQWGFFRQRIDGTSLAYRLLESGNRLRAQLLRRVFGDQAMWATREMFESVGGFPDEPLMEDVIISRGLGRKFRPAEIKLPLPVNARRWKKYGVVRQTLRNWWIQIRFLMGAKPVDLSRSYRRHDAIRKDDQ